jgi:D-aminopeptidase
VEWQTSAQAEMPLLLPGIKRTAARSISFSVTDYIEGFTLLRSAIALAAY